MAYEAILYDVADCICTITLNRPEKLNAWTRQMRLDLKHAMHKAGADPDVRAIILTGAGRGFCAGADMGGLQAIGAGAGLDRSTQVECSLPGGSTLPEFRMNYSYFPAIPKFIIAAINGPAAGLGFVIPLYADLRFARQIGRVHHRLCPARADRRARRELAAAAPGRTAGGDGPLVLGPQVPRSRSTRHRAGEPGHPRRQADGRDARLRHARTTPSPPRSVAVMKRQIWEAEFQSLAEATTQANYEMDLSFQTADFKEGVAHFLEKRAARFTANSA